MTFGRYAMPHWERRRGPPPTIADLLDHGDEVSVHCWSCPREGALDLSALAARYGRDLDFDRIRAKLRCIECRRRSEPGPWGGEHRTIVRLACVKRVTPSLGHLAPRGSNHPPPEIHRKRRRGKRDWINDDEATMCGRFKLTEDPETIRTNQHLLSTPQIPPRYNIAPTQDILVARRTGAGREAAMMRWGLVPAWSKDPKAGPPLINARAETVAEKPAFRDAFKKRRCLVVADGYYEWTGEKSPKQPWLITLTNGKPFGFAGLWERWTPKTLTEPAIDSVAIITTVATESLAFIHDRMPVVLTSLEEQDAWLDANTSVERLKSLLRPYPANHVRAHKVGRAVSNVRIDGPECIASIEAELP